MQEELPMENGRYTWEKAIWFSRKRSASPTLIEGISYIKNKGESLILGDASCVASKYLIEHGFDHVTTVDQSPLLIDDFYESEKLTKINDFFEDQNYPKNTYDYIFGESISFIQDNDLEYLFPKILNSLTIDGVFTSAFFLEENTLADASGIHNYVNIRKLYSNLPSNYTLIKETIIGPTNNTGLDPNKPGITHKVLVHIQRNS